MCEFPLSIKQGERVCINDPVGQRCSKLFEEDKIFNSYDLMMAYVESIGGLFSEKA
jgi:hypothetical protein